MTISVIAVAVLGLAGCGGTIVAIALVIWALGRKRDARQGG